MALIGGLAGLSLYVLLEVLDQAVLPDRVALGVTGFAAVFFTGWLAMTGPLAALRAAFGAALVAAATAVLMVTASLRFLSVEGLFGHPVPALAMLVLALVPLPFFIAASGPGWRDYPTLFTQAWTIVVRYAAAWLFVAVVWAVLLLSDALLTLVGLPVISELLEIEAVVWVGTGLALGLALAVVTELSDLVSPYLILRLLRLLLPVVLVVMGLFTLALPFNGLDGLFGGLSVSGTLLAMAMAAATLVTTAIDQSDAEAVQNPVMLRATQGLALLLPAPAVLAGWAIWLRVADFGWTPDRIFAVLAAAMALGYGLLYAVAVLRGPGWMARIRQSNVTMALAMLALAALWLTPLLNAEAISARNQVARLADGRVSVAEFDLASFAEWGKPGQQALADLERLAASPGQEALAARLSHPGMRPVTAAPETLEALRALLPLQPAGATAVRDRLLEGVSPSDHALWLTGCQDPLPGGSPGCVMVVGDFLPLLPGEEAIIAVRLQGYLMQEGLSEVDGFVQRRSVALLQGAADADALLAALQAGPPVLSPAAINQIAVGGATLVISP